MDLLGVPLGRNIDFAIDVEPGAKPIYISPCRMAPMDLKELME